LPEERLLRIQVDGREIPFGLNEIEMASQFPGAGAIVFVGEEILQDGQHEMAEPPLFPIDGFHAALLDEVTEEGLREILGAFGALAAPADEEVDRLPVGADQTVERILMGRGTGIARLKDRRPRRRREGASRSSQLRLVLAR